MIPAMRQIWPNRTQWMVITCMLLLLINNGFIVIGITAFDPVLLKELSLSVTALKSRDLIMLWSSGLMAPFIGYLADRFGVRPLFAIGTALLCAGMLAYAHVTSVWGLYAISVALGFSQACSGIVMAVIAISRWTGPHRGLAIGFAISGTSLGNAFVPQLNAWLITTLGWREAFMVLSAIPLFLFPLIFMVLREYVPGTKAISVPLKLAGFGVVIRSRNFILLSLAAAVSVFAVLGVTTNIILYAKSLALPASETGNLLWGFFGMSLLAQLAGGHFGDRLGAQRILLLGLALLAAGALALANPAHIPLIVGMLVMGMGWGSAVASLEHFASVLFAGPLFGRILGTLLMVETFVGGLGPVFVGNVYDRTGHFMTGFACISALCLIAVFMIACIRRDPVTRPDEIPLAAPVS